MLTFKNTKLFFGSILLLVAILDYFYTIPVWIYAVLVILFLSILFYGSYFIHSNFHMDVACNAATTKNEIALTFDDGPVEKNTEQILDILKSNGVEATFFCIGERISQNPAIIKRMDSENHLVGNHSFTHHFFFDLFSKEKMKQEITDTNSALEKITNRKMKFFRPPYGVTTPILAKAIKETGLRPIGWNVRSMDTVIKNEKQLLSKIKGKLKAGDVLLFHDTASVTINSLQMILNEIKQQGLQPVRLDKLFNTEAYG